MKNNETVMTLNYIDPLVFRSEIEVSVEGEVLEEFDRHLTFLAKDEDTDVDIIGYCMKRATKDCMNKQVNPLLLDSYWVADSSKTIALEIQTSYKQIFVIDGKEFRVKEEGILISRHQGEKTKVSGFVVPPNAELNLPREEWFEKGSEFYLGRDREPEDPRTYALVFYKALKDDSGNIDWTTDSKGSEIVETQNDKTVVSSKYNAPVLTFRSELQVNIEDEDMDGFNLLFSTNEENTDVDIIRYCMEQATRNCVNKQRNPLLRDSYWVCANSEKLRLETMTSYKQIFVIDGKEYRMLQGISIFKLQGSKTHVSAFAVPPNAELNMPKKDWFEEDNKATLGRDLLATDRTTYPLVFHKRFKDPYGGTAGIIDSQGKIKHFGCF